MEKLKQEAHLAAQISVLSTFTDRQLQASRTVNLLLQANDGCRISEPSSQGHDRGVVNLTPNQVTVHHHMIYSSPHCRNPRIRGDAPALICHSGAESAFASFEMRS